MLQTNGKDGQVLEKCIVKDAQASKNRSGHQTSQIGNWQNQTTKVEQTKAKVRAQYTYEREHKKPPAQNPQETGAYGWPAIINQTIATTAAKRATRALTPNKHHKPHQQTQQ